MTWLASRETPAAVATLSTDDPVDRKYRPDIQGLRAVAVVLVILYHAKVPGFQGGYVGVDVFFVLSGFLITGILLAERERDNHTSMLKFYARRARRILPAATLVLIATVIAAYVWLGFLTANSTADDGLWTAMFAANIHFAATGTQYLNSQAPPSPLQNYWSLAVEEQFYLIWPLLIAGIAFVGQRFNLRVRLAIGALGIVGASLAWSIIETPVNGVWAYFSPFTRAWELAAGALLAIALPITKRLPGAVACALTWLGLGGIITGALIFNASTSYPGSAVVVPVIATLAVIAGGTPVPAGGAETLLGTRPFQWIGLLSYSLYLWHWPLLAIANQHATQPLTVWQNLGLVAVAVVLSWLTFKLLENPVRTAKRLVSRPALSVAMGLTLVAIALGVCVLELHIHPHVQQIQTTSLGPVFTHFHHLIFGGLQ